MHSEDVSPWNDLSGWRIGGVDTDMFVFKEGDETVTVGISCPQGRFTEPVVTLPNGTKLPAQFTQIAYDDSFEVKFGGVFYAGAVLQEGTQLTVLAQGLRAELTYVDPHGFEAGDQAAAGGLHAPMPGKVVAVRVQLGDSVKKGQALVIVEAMKMEHTIIAPADGIVSAIHANIGEQVDEKRELIALE
jgi:3-methylcrotonyl-CoA carboxylase alpha subunit